MLEKTTAAFISNEPNYKFTKAAVIVYAMYPL